MKETIERSFQEAAFSLVEIVIGLGIAGIVAVLGQQAFNKVMGDSAKVSEISELTQVRRTLIKTVDCASTLLKPDGVTRIDECNPTLGNQFIKVYSLIPTGREGVPNLKNLLIDKFNGLDSFSGMGNSTKHIQVRASCVECLTCPGKKKILIEYKYRYPRSGVGNDPRASVWQDLFEGIPLGCMIP